MVYSASVVMMFVLSFLMIIWMGLRERTVKVDRSMPYHLGTYQADRRKARFYFLSGWTGLAAAFLGMVTMQVIAGTSFDRSAPRQTVLGISYGVGIWGLLIVGLVWSQVGRRVNEPNSDGNSLQPVPNDRDGSKN